MEYFFYCRDKQGSESLRRELAENHWTLMDGYADGMIARRDDLLDDHSRYFVVGGYLERTIVRGPLLSDDGREWLGSAMIVQLHDRDAVDVMLADEPYRGVGLFASIEVHNWQPGRRPTA